MTVRSATFAMMMGALGACGSDGAAAGPDGGPPGMAEVLAMNQGLVPALVASGGALYWTNLEPQMSPQGSVRTMATGGGAVTSVTTTAMMPGGLLVVGDALYFTQTNNQGTAGDVMKLSLTGGDPPGAVGGGGVLPGLAASPGGVYWASFGNNTFRLGDTGAPPTVSAEVIGGNPPGIAFPLIVAGGAVFWSPKNEGHRVAIGGGPSTAVATGLDAPIVGLAAGGADLYVATHKSIRRVPAAGGGAGTTIYTAPTDGSPLPIQALASDATDLYWVEVGVGMGGRVMKLAMAGGAPSLVADSATTPLRIAVDADGVYWTANFGGVPGQTSILRAPR